MIVRRGRVFMSLHRMLVSGFVIATRMVLGCCVMGLRCVLMMLCCLFVCVVCHGITFVKRRLVTPRPYAHCASISLNLC
jgi:hypothetical protein